MHVTPRSLARRAADPVRRRECLIGAVKFLILGANTTRNRPPPNQTSTTCAMWVGPLASPIGLRYQTTRPPDQRHPKPCITPLALGRHGNLAAPKFHLKVLRAGGRPIRLKEDAMHALS